MTDPKRGHRIGIAGIQHRAIRQHHPHAGQSAMDRLRGTAAHSARIIRDNAADFCRIDRGGIGANFALIRLEPIVRPLPNHPRLQTNLRTIL